MHQCERCKKCKEDVTWCIDPYWQEVEEEIWWRWLCDDCYWELCDET